MLGWCREWIILAVLYLVANTVRRMDFNHLWMAVFYISCRQVKHWENKRTLIVVWLCWQYCTLIAQFEEHDWILFSVCLTASCWEPSLSWTAVPKWTGWRWWTQNSFYEPQASKQTMTTLLWSQVLDIFLLQVVSWVFWLVLSIVIFNVTVIILGFYCEFYCSTVILITDLSSLFLCLEQNYGLTEVVVIIFPSNTPKIWRERGSSTSGDHHCYSWFLLWKIIRFPLLIPFTP